MDFIEALEIVVELANENVLEERQVLDKRMEKDREKQLEAVDWVYNLLEVLKDN